jgi:hypothetical protein
MAREAAKFSIGLHWITLVPGFLCLGIAAAVHQWGTTGLAEQVGLEDAVDQVAATIGYDLDAAVVLVAALAGVPWLLTALLRLVSTRLQVSASTVEWKGGMGAQPVTVSFGAIESLDLEQGALGRLLGYGTLHFRGRNALGRRRSMARPVAFRTVFNDQMSTWLCRDLGGDPRRKRAAG